MARRPFRRSLHRLVALAAVLAAPAWAQPGQAQGKASGQKLTSYRCEATFLTGQGGTEIGRKSFDYDNLRPGYDPVELCLGQAAQEPLPNAMAFACECHAK